MSRDYYVEQNINDKIYNEIDKALQGYEKKLFYHPFDINWICNRIDWAFRWKYITEDQKNELADRAIAILEKD